MCVRCKHRVKVKWYSGGYRLVCGCSPKDPKRYEYRVGGYPMDKEIQKFQASDLVPDSPEAQQVLTQGLVTFEQLEARRQAVERLTKEVMVEGTHYGAIAGSGGKKSLLLPGAELLMSQFSLHIDHEYTLEREDLAERMLLYRCRAFQLLGPNIRGTSYEATAFNRERRFWCRGGQNGCPKECSQDHPPSMEFATQLDNVRRRAYTRAVKGLVRLLTGTTGYFDLEGATGSSTQVQSQRQASQGRRAQPRTTRSTRKQQESAPGTTEPPQALDPEELATAVANFANLPDIKALNGVLEIQLAGDTHPDLIKALEDAAKAKGFKRQGKKFVDA